MSKKTRLITYNIGDRDRQFTGVDRSDIDIQSMVDRINAPDVQELVSTGDMFGYYGHEIRGRFGMNPPDVWVSPNGESIRIEPAFRTIKFSADNDGNVTTQHEFLDTDNGKYAQRLYANKAGGFSSAIMRKMGQAGKYLITAVNGFDYVRQPNYNTNRGHGMFDSLVWVNETATAAMFDSMNGITPHQAAIKQALETAILHQYDSVATAIQSELMINYYQKEALSAQDLLIARQDQMNNIKARQQSRKEELFDNLICPSVPFDEASAQWDSFNVQGTSDRDLLTTESAKQARINTESRKRERVSLFGRRH